MFARLLRPAPAFFLHSPLKLGRHCHITQIARSACELQDIAIPVGFLLRVVHEKAHAEVSSAVPGFRVLAMDCVKQSFIVHTPDSEIIPASAKESNVQAYLFNDYREDIGIIKSFFDANLALTAQPPQFSFYDGAKPIFTSPRYLPPTSIEKCLVKDSIVSHGYFVRKCSVEHSIVGIRSRLEDGVVLKISVRP